jgi:hypothetical protein
MFLVASGTPGENKNIICPAVTKLYVVRNNVSGGFSVTLKTSAGTGITVPNGTTMFLRCDGTDVVDALTRVDNFQAATLGVSSLTSGRVTYATTGGSLTDSANLTFNGTTLTAAAFSGPLNGTVGATTPATGAFTSVVSTSASGVLNRAAATQDGIALVGRAGGTLSYQVSLTPTTLSASRTATFPDADTTIPVATQVLTFSGPTAARTITFPDANFTAARTDAANSFTGTQTFLGSVVPATLTADSVGYTGTPLNEQSTAYTLVAADAGKSVVHPISDNNARTFTIPANGSVAYPVGTTITFINMINTVTIAITTDTMYLAGAGTTGSRTLAAYGMATAVKLTSTTWIISGNGLT